MRLTVVGAGPAYSDDPRSVGACYLVQHDGAALVLDLGHGAFAGLASRVRPERLTAILISHLHPDHFIDLVPVRHWLLYHLAEPGRVRVYGPAELGARLDGLHGEPGFAAESLDIRSLEPGVSAVGPFRVATARVSHTSDSYAFRVSVEGEGGPGLVYSGDVGDARDLVPLIRRGDTLLVEASFGPGPVPPGVFHLDGVEVGRLAAATGPGHVLVTHLLPNHDPAATVEAVHASFAGKVEVVSPGTVVEIGAAGLPVSGTRGRPVV
jgi:ribonuclease BN (tRNA processing enzyme)